MAETTLRLPYRVAANGPDQATGLAKAACRDEGWVVRTVASVRKAETDGQWVVTLVVRSKVAA